MFWKGAPYRCLFVARSGLFQMVFCKEILQELQEVLQGKLKLSEIEARKALSSIIEIGNEVKITGKLTAVKDDPDDDKFIEAALVAGAEFIVSGDRHLLSLHEYGQVRIINTAEFLNQALK
jgi:uncharacterized protein